MSTDYNAMCFKCKKYRHAGQHMGGVSSFGYGSTDVGGAREVAEFVFDHVEHGPVMIVFADDTPSTFENVDP